MLQLFPGLPADLEFNFRPPLSISVHSVDTFQASTTFAAAQSGIGLVLSDALTVRCRIPRKPSIAENLNSPRSVFAINPRDSELRNCSNDAATKWKFVPKYLQSAATAHVPRRSFFRFQLPNLIVSKLQNFSNRTLGPP